MNFNLISKKDQIRELLNFLKHSRIKTVKELLFSSVQYYWIYHQKQYLSREREKENNCQTLFVINISLLSFLPPPRSLQFDHFLNAANPKGRSTFENSPFENRRSLASTSLDLSPIRRVKSWCACVSIITTICVNADHPRARTERWLMPPISGSRSLLDRCRSRHASRRHFCYTYRSIVTVVQGLAA